MFPTPKSVQTEIVCRNWESFITRNQQLDSYIQPTHSKDLFILIISVFKNNIKKSQHVTDDLLTYITDVM